MIYAVIDTNVLVSAMLSRTPTAATVRLLNALTNKEVCPLFNEEIIAEYTDVLHRPKFNIPSNLSDAVIRMIRNYGIQSSRLHSEEHFPDPKDVVFYEVAMSKENAYLVTGNTKHFPAKPIVVTPAEMMAILEKEY